jgi:GNAT superfamily N-acetyltransferase
MTSTTVPMVGTLVQTLRACPLHLSAVVHHLWNEWSSDFLHHSSILSPDLMTDFLTTSTTNDDVPVVHILHHPSTDTDTLIGFAFINTEDAGVMPWLSPWLANVFIVPEFRGKGYASHLLTDVLPKYPTLYLWTYTKELSDYYVKFGFQVIDIIPQHGEHTNVHVMCRTTPPTVHSSTRFEDCDIRKCHDINLSSPGL